MGVLDRMPRHHERCPQSKSNSGIGGVIFDLDMYDRLHHTYANSTMEEQHRGTVLGLLESAMFYLHLNPPPKSGSTSLSQAS